MSPGKVAIAKALAKEVRKEMATRGVSITHARALELVARQLGYRDWNTASARLREQDGQRR